MCFRCGDKYSPKHQCKKQLLLFKGKEVEEDEGLAIVEELEEDNGAISLHAIKGMANSKIIKVEERVPNSTLRF